MPTEEEERKAKAERAKKLLAKRKAKATTSSSTSTPIPPTSPTPSSGDVLQSTRTSLSIEDRASIDSEAQASRIPPPPKGPARSKISSPVIPEPEETINGILEPEAGGAKEKERNVEDQQEISALLKEREDLRAQLSKKEDELKVLRADRKLLEEGKTRIQELENEKRDLSGRIESLEKESKELEEVKAKLQTTQKELDDVTRSRKTMEDDLQASKQREVEVKKKLEEDSAGVRKDLERAREREGSLEAEIAKLRQSSSTLKSDLDSRDSEIETLRTKSDQTSSDLKSLQSDHSTLQSQHTTLETEHTDLQSTLKSLQTELSSLKESSSKSSSQIAATESSLSTTKAELDKTKSSLSAEIKKLEATEKKRQALQDENSSLYTQLEEVRGKVTSVMQEKAELVSDLDDYKKKEKSMNEKISGLEAKAEKRNGNGSPSSRSVSRVREGDEPESSGSARRISQLETELRNLQSSYLSLQKERDILLSSPNLLSPNAESSRQFRNNSNNYPSSSPRMNNELGLGIGNVNRGMDAILPANVRHKRQVSLTALKARMGTDRSFSSGNVNKMESLNEDPGGGANTANHQINGRKQFGDEIVFCCPACEGDLITL